MSLNVEQAQIVRDIRATAEAHRLPPLLLVALGFLEVTTFDPYAAGDNGTSHGIFQIHIPAHGREPAYWTGRTGTQHAMQEMLPRWLRAYAAMGTRFEDDPPAFLRSWWQPAQGGSAVPTLARARTAIGSAEAALAEAGEDSIMVVERPHVLQFPAHPQNIRVRPAGVVYEGLVIHTTGGSTTVEQLGAWFGGGNLREGLIGSTHFGVGTDGRIGQYVDLSQQAIAHGNEEASTAKLVRENPGLSANSYLIGIEHLDGGVPGAVTSAQLEASAWLCAWLWETVIQPNAAATGATLDRDHLLQHRDLAPISKPRCASWPMSRIDEHLARIQARLTPTPPVPPIPPVPPDPTITIEQVQIGLIDKIVRQEWVEAQRDLQKITGS